MSAAHTLLLIDEANARLVAASPDLLEALRLVRDVLPHVPSCLSLCEPGARCDCIISMVRAAIAKAEGKS